MINLQKVAKSTSASFRRRPESSIFNRFWTPASAGVTGTVTIYDAVNIDSGYVALLHPKRQPWHRTGIIIQDEGDRCASKTQKGGGQTPGARI